MTNLEFIQKYLSYYGLKISKGRNDSMEPMLPFLMVDVMFQIYNEDISPTNARFDAKKDKKVWIENIHAFNKHYFAAFNIDELDFFIDTKVEEFEKYVSNDVAIVKTSVMSYMVSQGLGDLPFEKRKVLSSTMVCNVIAQSALIVWDRLFKPLNMFGAQRNNLLGIRRATERFMNHYVNNGEDLDCNQSEEVCKSVDLLCKKMIKWLII